MTPPTPARRQPSLESPEQSARWASRRTPPIIRWSRGASLSEFGVRVGTTQRKPAFSSGHGRRDQLADERGDPVLREASHSLTMDKITINVGSPFGSGLLDLRDRPEWRDCRGAARRALRQIPDAPGCARMRRRDRLLYGAPRSGGFDSAQIHRGTASISMEPGFSAVYDRTLDPRQHDVVVS